MLWTLPSPFSLDSLRTSLPEGEGKKREGGYDK